METAKQELWKSRAREMSGVFIHSNCNSCPYGELLLALLFSYSRSQGWEGENLADTTAYGDQPARGRARAAESLTPARLAGHHQESSLNTDSFISAASFQENHPGL